MPASIAYIEAVGYKFGGTSRAILTCAILGRIRIDHLRRFKTFTNTVGRSLLEKRSGEFVVLPKLQTLKLEGALQCNLELLARIVETRFILSHSMPSHPTSMDKENRDLTFFRLYWHGPVLDEQLTQWFKSLALTYASTSTTCIEVWQRSYNFDGYQGYPDLTQAPLEEHCFPPSSPVSNLIQHAQIRLEQSRLFEQRHTTEDVISRLWVETQIKDVEKRLAELQPPPLDDIQAEPDAEESTLFDDYYHVPNYKKRAYAMARVV